MVANHADVELRGSPLVTRHAGNPVLTPEQVPYRTMLAFNAGVVKHEGRYIMIFRNDYGNRETGKVEGTDLGLAFSEDGMRWEVEPEPLNAGDDHPLSGTADPRITVLDRKRLERLV